MNLNIYVFSLWIVNYVCIIYEMPQVLNISFKSFRARMYPLNFDIAYYSMYVCRRLSLLCHCLRHSFVYCTSVLIGDETFP